MSASMRSVARSASVRPESQPARGLAGAASVPAFVPCLTLEGIWSASPRFSRLAEKARTGKRIRPADVVAAFTVAGVRPSRRDGRAWDGLRWRRPRQAVTALALLGPVADACGEFYCHGFSDGWEWNQEFGWEPESMLYALNGAIAVRHPSYERGRLDGIKSREALWKAVGWF